MIIPDLDAILTEKFTPSEIRRVFEDLKSKKTDILTGEVRIASGVDNCCYQDFEDRFDSCASLICEKGKMGKYCFNAFRELETAKPPFERHEIDKARKAKKIRTLSIATIQDTIFQILIMESIADCIEQIFSKEVDKCSFAYRKNKSSKQAVQKIRKDIHNGYVHVLDGDIEKFFDKIDHQKLMDKIENLFGNNSLVENYLYRFIKTSRLPAGARNKKRNYKVRCEGIPQGGVLSGVLANIFLLEFDKFVLNELSKICHFKYYRYADDFVLLFKKENNIEEIFIELEGFLRNEGLKLHPLGTKTKILNLGYTKKDKLDFLGFAISPTQLRVKHDNVKKLLTRINAKIDKAPVTSAKKYLINVVVRIRPKIVGLEDLNPSFVFCPECCRCVPKRNWIGYFLSINDVRQLRAIDKKIRTNIHKTYYRKTNTDLTKSDYKKVNMSLVSLEKMYYKYKKIEKLSKGDYCNCKRSVDPKTKKLNITRRI